MARAAERAERCVWVAENSRRDPINRLARALIADGAIGEPRLIIETHLGGQNRIAITPWRHMKHTGTIAVDAGVHYADILRFLIGEVRTVFGAARLHEKVRGNTGSAGPGGCPTPRDGEHRRPRQDARCDAAHSQ